MKERIREILENQMYNKKVQPGYPDANGNTNVTWCNRYFMNCIRALIKAGILTDTLLSDYIGPKAEDWTTANDIIQNLELKKEYAIAKPDEDFLIATFFNRHGNGHICFYDVEKSICYNVGKTNGILTLRQSFGSNPIVMYPLSRGVHI